MKVTQVDLKKNNPRVGRSSKWRTCVYATTEYVVYIYGDTLGGGAGVSLDKWTVIPIYHHISQENHIIMTLFLLYFYFYFYYYY